MRGALRQTWVGPEPEGEGGEGGGGGGGDGSGGLSRLSAAASLIDRAFPHCRNHCCCRRKLCFKTMLSTSQDKENSKWYVQHGPPSTLTFYRICSDPKTEEKYVELAHDQVCQKMHIHISINLCTTLLLFLCPHVWGSPGLRTRKLAECRCISQLELGTSRDFQHSYSYASLLAASYYVALTGALCAITKYDNNSG